MAYWDRALAARINRRRAIAATGGTTLAAAFLAACGGGKDNTNGGNASALLNTTGDSSDKAVPGGIVIENETRDTTSLDPFLAAGRNPLRQTQDVYDRALFRLPGQNGQMGPITGNAAESFELAPDGLTLTMKLRQNHTWDVRPPTSGRAMNTQDVMYSWKRSISVSVFAGDLYNGINKSAPVVDMTIPDDKTFVFKLAYPSRSILNTFTHVNYFRIMPIEAEDKFDPRNEARGSGPFTLEKWDPGLQIQFRKKPNWWMKGHPYIDGINRTFINDGAAILAQFETGNIWWNEDIKQEDILRLKNDHPTLVMRQKQALDVNGNFLVLSQQPDSPLKDARVRRAASMLIDRDLWIETFYNTNEFEAAGLPIDKIWNSCITGAFPEALRPNVPDLAKKLGDGAQYYQYNVAEAKKLLTAAGYNGKPLDHFIINPVDTVKANELLNGFLREGFTTNFKILTAADHRAVCQLGRGTEHNGFCYTAASGLSAEEYLSGVFLPEGKFAAWKEGTYPEVDAMVRKMKTEVDEKKQQDLITDIQKWSALNMPTLMYPGQALGFTLRWPWLENSGVFVPDTNGYISPLDNINWWYNKAKDPKAKTS